MKTIKLAALVPNTAHSRLVFFLVRAGIPSLVGAAILF